MRDRFVLGRGRPLLLVATVAVSLVAAVLALGVEEERGNESMRSAAAAARRTQEAFRRDFGNDEVILVAAVHPRLLEPEGLAWLAGLTARIGGLEGVERATSLTNVRQIVPGEYGATPAPLLPGALDPATAPPPATASGPAAEAAPGIPTPEAAAALRAALDRNPHLTGLLISTDRRTAGIVVELADRPDADEAGARLVEVLRAIEVEPLPPGAELHLTGLTVQKHDTAHLVARDQRVLLPLSVLMLAATLWASTRRLEGVVVPLLVTGITVLWTIGLYAALGYRVNVITALLPPLGMVLSITTGIHLFKEWAALGPTIPDRGEAWRRILAAFVSPCFMTSLTTAIGLGSLLVSAIPAVRLFGAFGAFSIMLSFGLNFTVLPAILSYLPPPAGGRPRGGAALEEALARAAGFALSRPAAVLLVAALLTVAAGAGIPRIQNNTDLVRFLRSDEPLVRDTRFIDRTLGAANALEFTVERRDGRPLTSVDDVRRLDALARGVREVPSVTGIFALTDLLAQMQRAETGSPDLSLPSDPVELQYLFDLLEQADDPRDIRRLVTADFRRARLNVRLRSIGTREAEQVLDRIGAVASRALGDGYELTPTGGFYEVTVDSNRLVASQVGSFGVALALVLAAVGITLRSGRLLLAAIIPNVVPIAWTAGMMGWFGIDLSTATMMVASVVLGVAVDDAIHYLARFRRSTAADLEGAVIETTRTTGRVLVSTTAVLALGFWVGATSAFKPTIYFSALAGITLVTALACTLLLLPACLRLLRAGPGA